MDNVFDDINSYFDKIYVLTLPRLKSRIEYINKTLKGLNFEFFYGVDKEDVSYDDLQREGYYENEVFRLYNKRPNKMRIGMLCCAIGHVKMYESIILNGYKKTLILEDDAIIIENNLAFFNTASKELPEDWDIWYLGYEKNEERNFFELLDNYSKRIIPYHTSLKMTREIFTNFYPKKISSHISRAGFHDCTHAYGITLDGAIKLIREQKPVKWNPDNALAYLGCNSQLNNYIITPKLFNQFTAFNENNGTEFVTLT